MLLWFAGLAFLGVVLIFSSPAIDYRLVMAGAVLPVIEWPLAGPWIAHTLIGSVVLLAAVMLVLRGRRLLQRRWLGLPIGTFMHLVLDGTWATKELFWWPAFGFGFGEWAVPEANRSPVALIAMELLGAAALLWIVRNYRLTDPERRRAFFATGHLDRKLVA